MEDDRRSADWHLTAKLLRALDLGEVDPGVCLSLLLEHLGSSCPTCGEGIAAYVQGVTPSRPTEPVESVLHDGFFEHAAAHAHAYRELEAAAARQWRGIRSLPSRADRLRAVTACDGRDANPALVALLLEEARGRVDDAPAEAGELAELAEAVALRLGDEPHGRSLRRDLLAEARAHRANALRAEGELERAEALLARVGRHLPDCHDPFLLAEVATFRGSLAKDLRRFEESLEHFDEAERRFREIDAGPEQIVRVRLLRARVLALQGRPEDAVALALEVVEEVEGETDRDLRLVARHVAALCSGAALEPVS